MELFLPEPEFETNIYPDVISSVPNDKAAHAPPPRRSNRTVEPTVHLHYDSNSAKSSSGRTLSEMKKVRMRLSKKPTLAAKRLRDEAKKHAKYVSCHADKVTLKLRGAHHADSGHALTDLLEVAMFMHERG